ncbi:glycoside hydrolase domain-containing protein, partial [Thomasclavelia sp.]
MKKYIIKVLLIAAMCLSIVPITNTKADSSILITETENEIITTINSSYTGMGLNQFDFHGKWVYESNPSYTNLYMNDGHYVIPTVNQDASTNYYEISFEGNRVELYGNLEPQLGIMRVEIDGTDYGTIDLYHAQTKLYQQLLFDSGELNSNEMHKIRVTLTGEKNPDAVENNGYIDFAKVYKAKSTAEAHFTLEKGKTFQIPQVSLQDVSSAIWESSDSSIATVNDGLVHALKVGTTVITASNENERAEIEITVIDAIQTNDKEYEFRKINDSVTGSGLEQFQYFGNWGVDRNINTLYQNDGHWVLVPENDDSQSRYFTMRFMGNKISIYGNKEPVLGIGEVYIDGKLYGTVDAYHEGSKIYQQLYFESPILANDQEHELKFVMTGKRNEKAENQNGYVDFVEIVQKKEKIYPTEITLDDTMSLEINAEKTLDVQFTPANTNQRELTWKISDPSIVSIDEANTLTALKEGSTTIQATGIDKNGNLIQSNVCSVTVLSGNLYFHGTYGSTNKTYFLTDYDKLMASASLMSNSVTGWRGDRIYSEIVLLSKKYGFDQLKVEATDFKDSKDNVIKAENIKPSFLKYNKSSPTSGTAGANAVMTPDIIYGDTMDVMKQTVQPIWVEMNIPENSIAGDYTGKIRIMDGDQELISFEQKIEVIDLVQPSITEKNSYYLELWNYVYSTARYYDVELMSDEHLNILRPHLKQYVDNGGKTVMATIVEEPWNHQTYDDSPSMIKWTKKADGTFTFDFTLFDKYASFVFGEEIAETISCYSIIPWNNQVAYFDEATNSIVKKSMPVGSEDWTQAWTQFLTKFTVHLEEKGWYDHIWMAMDERGRADMTGAIDLINSIPNSKGEHFKISGAFNQVIPDIWVQMYHVSPNLRNALGYGADKYRELAEERRKEGLLTTIYTCTGNFPNMYNMSNPSEAAWTIWMAESLNTDGFMRWAYDSWVEDPLVDASHSRFETGDVQMVYPGDKELLEQGAIPTPRSTPRTERLYEAIRDIQKLRYLKEVNPASADDITTFIRSVKNFNDAGNTIANKTAVDAEMDRMKAGLVNFSKMYVNGNMPGNITTSASIVGADEQDERLHLIDGKLATTWNENGTTQDLTAEIRFDTMQDISKLRIYTDKNAQIKDLNITVIDEQNRRIALDWFQEGETTTAIEKQYTAWDAAYIGYAKAVEVNIKPSSKIAIQEVMLFAANQQEISKEHMSVKASSEETSSEKGAAVNMIDGNTNTIWHSHYSGTVDRPPYTVDLDLGASYSIDSLAMLPRQSGSNGIITKYDLMVSETGVEGDYTTVVENGVWSMDASLKNVDLAGQQARYIRLVIKEANQNFGSIAELYVYQKIAPGDRNLERAQKAVILAQNSLSDESYAKAVYFVSLLADSDVKDQLNQALKDLQKIDKSQLQALYDEVKEYLETDYTADSWKEFKSAMDVAKDILDKADATQVEIDNAKTALENAKDNLVEKTETPDTNKAALSIAIDMAEAVTQEQLDKVVPVVANEFKAALQNAQNVFDNVKATQEEVNNAFDRLAKVMQMLEFYKGDKAALQKMMDQIASLSASDYTDSTWNALQAVLPNVNEVLGNVNAMQEEV